LGKGTTFYVSMPVAEPARATLNDQDVRTVLK
jgi:hypothetical protein